METKSLMTILNHFQGENYLIPKDDNNVGADLRRRALSVHSILEKCSESDPFATIFLLDCCRTYPVDQMNEKYRSGVEQSPNMVGLKEMSYAGSLIAFACAPGAVANECPGERNGLFTKHILQHISKPDQDIRKILADVTNGVAQESNFRQRPYLSVSLTHTHVCLYENATGT
ncbi:unnamed protein product [Rotaria magnacalcarata]|uniref:Peptidase C14 caspase domain-containing protein n=2 Tax=Rotaria magnacalcarata TaxID=392030 RepID=A0A817AJX2_9BILA|nr:unnamed protein product [Rotaria magnacalcarata]CAF2258309.1 unnamed protein product [Rotaria magnacalcarata]